MTVFQTCFILWAALLPARAADLPLDSAWSASQALLSRAARPTGPRIRAAGPGGCVFDGRFGRPAAPADAAAAWARSRAVSVGETHDQANDHLVQLEALKAMFAAHGKKTVVGFEMLNMNLQSVLDAYAAGRLSEAEFLEQADWKKEWGFPFPLYKPIFDFIREQGLQAIALNAPRSLVARTARLGLDGLSPEEKAILPRNMQLSSDPRYRAFLKEAFGGHGRQAAYRAFRAEALRDPNLKGMPVVSWEHYLEAMMIWNEVMADRVAQRLNQDAGSAVLVAAGNGHVMYGAGIPFGISRRAPGAAQTTVFTEGGPTCPSALPEGLAGIADYVWVVPHTAAQP
ncbi:MAG: ChaN family lipoprotein [Elusimicrobiota bacterium]|jgi:uncharacterized iron-regulated protein